MNVKFSIITVTFNNCSGLKNTINSILYQTYKNFEILIVDGGSNDSTLLYANTLNDNRILFHSEKDAGIYDAQNKGINRSKGDFLIFLNAGDIFDNPFVLETVSTNCNTEIDVIYGKVNLRLDDGNIFLQSYPNEISKYFWVLGQYLCHQIVFFRKKLFLENGLYDLKYKYAADFDFISKIWNVQNIVKKYIDFTITVYELQGVSGLSDNRKLILDEYSKIILKRYGYFDYYIYLLNSRFGLVNKIEKILKGGMILLSWFYIVFIKKNKNYKITFSTKSNQYPSILHFSTSDSKGGAAQAAYKIHRSLVTDGIDSWMVVKTKNTEDERVIESQPRTGISWLIERITIFFTRYKFRNIKLKNKVLLSFGDYSYLDVKKILNILNPDIIHLHWICYDFLSIDDLLLFDRPIVWTLHDMWPFSGAEHISFKEEYKRGYPSTDNINFVLFNKKLSIYKKLSITPVGVSKWMKNISEESLLFKNFQTFTIPNIIDLEIFYPKDKEKVRSYFDFKSNFIYILFGSDYKDDNKGFDDILRAIEYFDRSAIRNICFICFGSVRIEINLNSISILNFGYINNKILMSDLYSAVDITLVPSRLESFCLIAAESISCGTPVVSYDTSGLQDIVLDGMTGYKAKCYDVLDFIKYIELLLDKKEREKFKANEMHKNIAKKFSDKRVIADYLDIYKSIKADL